MSKATSKEGFKMRYVDRRAVMAGALGLAATPAFAQDKMTPSQVEALYRRAVVLDTLMAAGPNDDEIKALAAGLTGGVCDLRAFPRNKINAEKCMADWQRTFDDPSRRFLKILKADDFARAKTENRFAVVLTSQNADILDSGQISNGDDNIENLRAFHEAGLRVLLLTYTDANSLGDGYNEPSNGGLKNLGRAVVPEMNKLGMVVDVSHSGERTSLEAIALSTRPVSVTHAGCLALDPNLRNKSDKVIRALADKGGYFGVYNMTLWMTRKPTSSVEDIVDHIDHAVKVGGIDLVGFGSDQDVTGNPIPNEKYVPGLRGFARRNKGLPAGDPQDFQHVYAADINVPDRLLIIAQALARRGYKGDAIEKILGANFIRTFRGAVG
jgi:membrane dipeptidase